MSSLEILDYRYTNSWNLDLILKDSTFNNNLKSNFPTIVTTETGVSPDAQSTVWQNFLSGKRRAKPSNIRQSHPDSTVSYVSQCLGTNKECFISNATCSSSSYALYLASLISMDRNLPVVVFCGDNLQSSFELWKFNSFGALDQDTGLPFDKSSKGFKMGSGAAVLLVKHPSVKFNIDPKAVIKQFNFYTNPFLVANPGSVSDIVKHFSDVNFTKTNFWNAHATGTPSGDAVEYEFFNSVCNDSVPIVSYKHYIGHCISGANSLEIIMAIEGKKNNCLLPNLISLDKINNDDRIITSPMTWPGNNMLKVSFGFGGRTSILDIELI